MLSKSDFIIASTCSKKLVYKKLNYKTKNDENEFLEMLAQGGHIIGKYARLLYPEGIEIKGESNVEIISETKRLFEKNDKITLFESGFESNNKIGRIDILVKNGNTINIIEVKSKSFDSGDKKSKSDERLRVCIEDLAFQTMVMNEIYPNLEIHSYLLLPDKSKRTDIEGLAGWFSMNNHSTKNFEIDELPAQNSIRYQLPLVEFKYSNHPEKEKYIASLSKNHLLSLINFDKEVFEIMGDITNRSNQFLNILKEGIKPEHYKINKNCSKCEFNLGKEEEQKNGYRECWQGIIHKDPHIFDLYYGGLLKGTNNGWYFDELISEKKISFWDLEIDRFRDKNGELGSRGLRQLLQYENTKTNSEWISPDLKSILGNLKYPLHFIDFETYTGAIPHHKGMRPYEMVAFQWSCHTVVSPGSEPQHSGFINSNYEFPNFIFAESLMNQIGTSGTPLMWSSFENTALRNILEQMDTYNYQNESLREWLTNITTNDKLKRRGRFVDMNELTLDHYFRPEMKGKTSIKKVLPAIWNNNEYLHSIPWFQKYAPNGITSLNPYDSLSPIFNELENEEVVKDGTGAMRCYNALMFGEESQNITKRQQLIHLLHQYCELDTMAMVIIWKYWMDKCGLD